MYLSLPGWWSWCLVRRNSRQCSCKASGSLTPWRCWWWGWRQRLRPQMVVCSAPLCTSPSGSPSLSPTHSPSMPKPVIFSKTLWTHTIDCYYCMLAQNHNQLLPACVCSSLGLYTRGGVWTKYFTGCGVRVRLGQITMSFMTFLIKACYSYKCKCVIQWRHLGHHCCFGQRNLARSQLYCKLTRCS